jgi:predicted molibdopterin-dependent oxidoreductase YjgC
MHEVLGFGNRGRDIRVVCDEDVPMGKSSCVRCGECVQVCPVGALVYKSGIGQARSWDVNTTRTICPYCGVGCNVDVVTTKDDRGLTTPLIRKDGRLVEASWDEALDVAAKGIATTLKDHGARAVGCLSSAKVSNEENYAIMRFARGVLKTNNIDHCARL